MLQGVTGPLGWWRVVELTDLRGAMCGRILADLGAQVTSVRPPGYTVPDGLAVAERYRNAGKEVVTAAPGEPAGRRRLHDLLAGADVLVENMTGGARAAAGLDPEEVSERYPSLVHVVMADFGLDGPRSGWRLDPITAQAAGGTLFASGFPDRAPCWFPGYLGPDCASVYGFVGAVAAMFDRARHGRGQLVEVSVQEATLAGTNPWSVAISDYLKINPFLPAEGRRNADGYYWVLPARDGWVRTVIGNDKQWRGFVRLLGEPEVLMAPEWSEALYRRMNGDVIRLGAGELLADRTRLELFEQALEAGATLGVIHSPAEFVDHPQTAARGVFGRGGLPGLEGAPVVRPPLRFSGGEPPAPPGPPDATAGGGGELPLAGTTVVEFGMAAVGPEVSLVLSELGADVIKIESSAHLDVLRVSGFERVNCGFAFNAECRGRRSVALNLDTGEGRELAAALCARADVVVENYRGGVLDRMGLGYDSVKVSNPGVVYASSQGYGRRGPLAEMPAYGPLNLGFVGLHHLWNHPDSPYPCGTSLNHPDHLAGKFLAAAVLIALDHRARTGSGQRVDLAQTDFAAYLRGEVYIDSWLQGGGPPAAGNSSPAACPHGVFPASGEDRWIAVAVNTDGEWAALCRALGWDLEPALTGLAGRLGRAAEIEKRLSAWTAERDPVEAAAFLQERGVTAAPVMGPLDHLADEHLAARGFIVTLEHPEVGAERHVGNPVRMSVTAQRVAASAPCLGADTAAVLEEILGLGPARIEALVAAEVCV